MAKEKKPKKKDDKDTKNEIPEYCVPWTEQDWENYRQMIKEEEEEKKKKK